MEDPTVERSPSPSGSPAAALVDSKDFPRLWREDRSPSEDDIPELLPSKVEEDLEELEGLEGLEFEEAKDAEVK